MHMYPKDKVDYLGPEGGIPSPDEIGITEKALGAAEFSETTPKESHLEIPDKEAKQLDPIPGNLREYIQRRFSDEKAFVGSRFGKELNDDNRAEYVEGLQEASAEIITALGIERGLFDDERYTEAFLVAADSWLYNE